MVDKNFAVTNLSVFIIKNGKNKESHQNEQGGERLQRRQHREKNGKELGRRKSTKQQEIVQQRQEQAYTPHLEKLPEFISKHLLCQQLFYECSK